MTWPFTGLSAQRCPSLALHRSPTESTTLTTNSRRLLLLSCFWQPSVPPWASLPARALSLYRPCYYRRPPTSYWLLISQWLERSAAFRSFCGSSCLVEAVWEASRWLSGAWLWIAGRACFEFCHWLGPGFFQVSSGVVCLVNTRVHEGKSSY